MYLQPTVPVSLLVFTSERFGFFKHKKWSKEVHRITIYGLRSTDLLTLTPDPDAVLIDLALGDTSNVGDGDMSYSAYTLLCKVPPRC